MRRNKDNKGENIVRLNYELCGGVREIRIKNRLDIRSIVGAASHIAENVARYTDDGVLVYGPEVFEFAYRINLCMFFTDLKMPEDIDERMKIAYAPGLIVKIENAIGNDIVQQIRAGAEERIRYVVEKDIRKSPIDSLLRSFAGLLDAVKEKVGSAGFEDIINFFEDASKDMIKNTLREGAEESSSDSPNKE